MVYELQVIVDIENVITYEFYLILFCCLLSVHADWVSIKAHLGVVNDINIVPCIIIISKDYMKYTCERTEVI